jgi:hypothetical protein
MKMNLVLPFLFIMIVGMSCQRMKFENPMSIADFYTFTDSGNITCNNVLPHENEPETVIGWCYAINTFENENKFFLYNTASDTSLFIEVYTTANTSAVFDKLADELSVSNPVQITVHGDIRGVQLVDDNGCRKSAYLEIDDVMDILF